jgi:hypothetical protein
MLMVVIAAWLYPTNSTLLIRAMFDPLTVAAEWATALSIFVFLPTRLFARTKAFSRLGFGLAAWVFGAMLWLSSWALVYRDWGRVAATLGAAICGGMVVPMGVVAALAGHEWNDALGVVLTLLLWLTAMFASRQRAASPSTPSAARFGYLAVLNELPRKIGEAYLLALIFGLPNLAWLTHVIYCWKHSRWGMLIAGAIFFPGGIVHGWALWLSSFHRQRGF